MLSATWKAILLSRRQVRGGSWHMSTNFEEPTLPDKRVIGEREHLYII